jgi:hypothetical protein
VVTLTAGTLAGALVGPPGCGSQVDALCDLSCDCTTCTEDQEKSCRNGSKATYDSSVEKGCTAEADAYLDCYEAEFKCESKQVDVSACDDKKKVWNDCLAGTTTVETDCDKASTKVVEECQVEDPGSTEECEGVPACNAACLLAASCEEIRGEAEGNLAACLEACLSEGGGM